MSTTPEAPAAQPPEKAEGLATYLKVIYAPGEAFATLARVPTWGWAAIIGSILAIAAALLILPASMHYSHIVQEQQFSQMPADQAAAAREVTAKIPQWVYPLAAIIFTPIVTWFVWLFEATGFLIGAALGGGEARFRNAWAAAINAYLILALGSLGGGIILWLRGPDNVNSPSDLFALPSAAMFVHAEAHKLGAFLYYALNIASIWYYVVAVVALEQALKMSRVAAIVTVIILALLGAGIPALFAK